MFTTRALQKAKKKSDSEKVGLNIKVPVGLKNEFDTACKNNNVSMTEMMLSLIEVFVEDSKGIMDESEQEFHRLAIEKIEENEKFIDEFEKSIKLGTYEYPSNIITSGVKMIMNDIEIYPDDAINYGNKIEENKRLRKLLNLEEENDSNN